LVSKKIDKAAQEAAYIHHSRGEKTKITDKLLSWMPEKIKIN
jgi:hypothetical protein